MHGRFHGGCKIDHPKDSVGIESCWNDDVSACGNNGQFVAKKYPKTKDKKNDFYAFLIVIEHNKLSLYNKCNSNMLTSVEIRDRSSSQLDLMELGDGGGTLTEEISTPLIACPSSASLTPLIQEEESGDVTNPMRVLIYTTSYNVIDG